MKRYESREGSSSKFWEIDRRANALTVRYGRIGTDGRMKDLRVVSSPHPDLERAALDAVSEWEFAPTMLNGRTVETRIGITVRFQPGH